MTGCQFYDQGQVITALVIHRFRDLGDATGGHPGDPAEVITAHLERIDA